ncbi:uncharacterized protein LOC114364648 [Ostrinia furnacalis]|uniref:uncharacterized protein LOC114364648 n=1 Tax=Ostrinia furnacalis TaxID=93504 RepID=UPI001039D902|nr:uncharacterized protein LOC114364648 [Ostrinia furnacalis]
MCVEICLIPKKFLCVFSLKCGAYAVGIWMSCFMFMVAITVLVESINYCWDFPGLRWYCIDTTFFLSAVVTVIDSIYLMLVNLCLIWGIYKDKVRILLCWLALTTFGLVHVFVIMVTAPSLLHYGFTGPNHFIWIVCLIIAVVAIVMGIYSLLVVYAYYLELKQLKTEGTNETR